MRKTTATSFICGPQHDQGGPPCATVESAISQLKSLIEIQCTDGNWNYDPYMHGLANGLLVALSVLDGKNPRFKDAPDVWLKDKNKEQSSDTKALVINVLSRANRALANSKTSLQDAYAIVCKAMKDDPEYAWSWHCNVAMCAYDAGAPHDKANEYASTFMKNAFGVDTYSMIEDRTNIVLSADLDTPAKVMGVFRKCGIVGFKKPKLGGSKSVKMCCLDGEYPHTFLRFESVSDGFVFQAFKNSKENYRYDKLTRPIKDITKFLEKLLTLRQLKAYHSKIKEYLDTENIGKGE